MKTRTKKASRPATGAADVKAAATQTRSMEPTVASPPTLSITPNNLSPEARIVTVPGRKATTVMRILLCPEQGFFEFANIASESSSRSWLLAPNRVDSKTDAPVGQPDDRGYVLRRPDLLVATPLDPLFILLPMMLESQDNHNSYLSSMDYIFNEQLSGYGHLQQLLRQPAFARTLQNLGRRMATISTSISLGDNDDDMYQLSIDKVARVLLAKSTRMAELGLPTSLEQRFVQQALEIPFMHIDQVTSTAAVDSALDQHEASIEESQSSLSSETSIGSTETAATSVASMPDLTNMPSDQVVHLLRIRTAWNYMLRSYVSSSLQAKLETILQQQTTIDFMPLREREERVNGLRQKAQALRTLSDNISRKRMLDDDEESAKADEKRRKKEVDEQRKKSMSHGVKKLMKADTSGMKKMSSFFTKTPAK